MDRCSGPGWADFSRWFQRVRNVRGTGQVITDPCKKCKGKGHIPKKRKLSVKIPAGVHEGQGIRVTGEGEPGRLGGPRGDLYCYVRVKAHPFMMRDGSNLVVTVPLSFTQMALGGTIDVPTLENTRQLKIPAGSQHGNVMRIRGEGLPDIRGGRKGDLLVQLVVEIPKKLSTEQERLLREYAKTEEVDVNSESKTFFEKIKTTL